MQFIAKPSRRGQWKMEDSPDPQLARYEVVAYEPLKHYGCTPVEAGTESEAADRLGLVPYVQPLKTADVIDKLTLKRNLDALGKWAGFKAAMAQLPEGVQEDFNLAATIRKTDPTFIEYAPQLKALLELTDGEYEGLFSA